MDTEVYLLCRQCNKITLGIGTEDLRTLVTCKECGKKFISCFYYDGGFFYHNDKRLYSPEK